MRKKILIDGRFYGLEHAGIGRYVIELVSNLATIPSELEYYLFLHKKYFNKLKLPSNWTCIGLDIPHYSFAEQVELPKQIEKVSPDLVHFPHFNVPIFSKCKSVVTIHDMLWHKQKGLSVTSLPLPLYLIKYLGYRLVFSKAVNNSCKIIVPSKAVRADLLSYYNLPAKKVKVIYEGVTGPLSKAVSLKSEDQYFLYVGSTYPHKNVQIVVDAIVKLNQLTTKKYKLKIVSSRSIFKNSLLKYLRKVKAEKYVEFLGFVPDSRLAGLYQGSQAFVFPSLSEGFGLPGLEAMANYAIVIASDLPVFREIYGKHAFYFDPRSSSDLVEKMKKVVEMDNKKKIVLKRQASRYTHSYSWQETARRTLEVYEDCIGLRQSK